MSISGQACSCHLADTHNGGHCKKKLSLELFHGQNSGQKAPGRRVTDTFREKIEVDSICIQPHFVLLSAASSL